MARLNLEVEIVTSAHHRADGAGGIVDQQGGAFRGAAILAHRRKTVLDRLLGRFLQLQVQRQLDHHVRRRIGQKVLHALHGIVERVAGEAVRLVLGEDQLLGLGLVGLRLRDEAFLHHLVQHVFLPLLGLGAGGLLGEARGRFREGRHHRRLSQREVHRRLVEIGVRRSVETVGACAEIDAVEVEIEDLVLGQHPFEVASEARFLRLALHGLVRGEEQVLHQLLRDGGGALDRAALGGVRQRGANDRHEVNARVFPEPLVLSRDERIHHMLGQRLGRDGAAIAEATHRDRVAVGVDELDRRRAVQRPQRLLVGQGRHLREQRVPQQAERDEAGRRQRADDFQHRRSPAHQGARSCSRFRVRWHRLSVSPSLRPVAANSPQT